MSAARPSVSGGVPWGPGAPGGGFESHALATPSRPRLLVRHCGVTVARVGVRRLHRHLSRPPLSALVAFEVVLRESRWPVGFALVGRPVSRHLDAAGWVELTRCATDGTPNACSALYGAAARWAWTEGRPLLTYTREDEGGASLRGAGWVTVGTTRAERWSRAARPREAAEAETVAKVRWIPVALWEAAVSAIASICVVWP